MRRYSADQNADGTAYIRTVPIYSGTGTLTVKTGATRIYNDSGVTLNIVNVRASVGTAPTGAGITVDVKKGGTSIWNVSGNRPTIAVSTNTIKSTSMTTTTWEDGSYLTADIVTIGSTVAGADITIQVAVA
jgi:hypothetical protein